MRGGGWNKKTEKLQTPLKNFFISQMKFSIQFFAWHLLWTAPRDHSLITFCGFQINKRKQSRRFYVICEDSLAGSSRKTKREYEEGKMVWPQEWNNKSIPFPSCSPNLVLALPVFSSNYEHTRERMKETFDGILKKEEKCV